MLHIPVKNRAFRGSMPAPWNIGYGAKKPVKNILAMLNDGCGRSASIVAMQPRLALPGRPTAAKSLRNRRFVQPDVCGRFYVQ